LELEPFLVELLMADMPAPGILREVNDDDGKKLSMSDSRRWGSENVYNRKTINSLSYW
jgi:hypothetical protein